MALDRFRSWYGRSWRRKAIDADLARWSAVLTGRVLNVGSRRRGLFQPPKHLDWIDLDLVPAMRPTVVGDAHRLPLRDASLDAMVCAELLEHVREPGLVVAEAARVLRPGGLLLVTVPFHVRIHPDPEDHHRFTDAALRRLVEPWFEVVELAAQGGPFAVFGDLVRSAAEQGKPLSTRALPFLTALTAPLVRLERRRSRDPARNAWTTGYLVAARRRASAGQAAGPLYTSR